MNVLITGGAGYIGTELVRILQQESTINQIVIYDNLSRNNFNLFLGKTGPNAHKIRIVKGDILDTRKLKKEVDQSDIVYHLAAKVSTPFADHHAHEFDQINNWGTAELVYLVEQSNVSKFIYASSVSVYGASDTGSDLSSPLTPSTFYGVSKMHGEDHVKRLFDKGIQTHILRLGNVFGYSKSMRFDSVINKFVFEANFSKRIRIFGDGKQTRTFIHIDRLAKELSRYSLENVSHPIANLVENTFSVNEIVDVLKEIYPSLEMVYVNQNMRMRSMNVTAQDAKNQLLNISNSTLLSDLQEFRSRFSF